MNLPHLFFAFTLFFTKFPGKYETMSTDTQFLQSTADHVRAHTARAEKTFAEFSVSQLNWQPNPGVWSVGLILNHLVTTNGTYFPQLEAIAAGTYKMKLWTKISPFSGILGRSMIKQLGPDYAKKYTSPPAFRPVQSKVSTEILDQFGESQNQILSLLNRLEDQSLGRIKIASPASGFITYSLKAALTVIDVHTARHLQQADRLIQQSQFPA